MSQVYLRIGIDELNTALNVACVKLITLKVEKENIRLFELGERKQLTFTTMVKNVETEPGQNMFGGEVNLVSSTHCNPGSDIYYWSSVTMIKVRNRECVLM
jgi:hypothetical protein